MSEGETLGRMVLSSEGRVLVEQPDGRDRLVPGSLVDEATDLP